MQVTDLLIEGTTRMSQPLVDALLDSLGADKVESNEAALQRYSHDAWPVAVVNHKLGRHQFVPDAAVCAGSVEDVVATIEVAQLLGVPVTARGLGSSVTGQALPVQGGILLDLSGLVGEPELDEVNLVVRAPGGVRGSDLETWLNERGFTLNHFPQSLGRSSIAGWLATRATGQLSSRYGGIEDLVFAYTVILADGSSVSVGSKPRAAVGPDLRELFLGSEGTFGVIVDVTLKVFPLAEHTQSQAFEMPDIASGINTMREITRRGLRPSLVRFYDQDETCHAVPTGDLTGCALFLSHEGVEATVAAERKVAAEIATRHGGRSLGPSAVDAWYRRRFDFSTVEKFLAQTGGYAETIEVAHLWTHIGALHRALRTALAPLADEVLGHFSHVYTQGASLYVILLGKAGTDEEAARRLEAIWKTAMTVTLAHGGELSHHHGAGLARQEFIPASLGSQHGLIRRLKTALDPNGILNPGKLGLD